MRLRRRAARILSDSGLTEAEWSILLADDNLLRELNNQYRGEDRTTDVLSFALSDDLHPYLLGDVVISVEQASRQSEQPGDEGTEHELVRLLVHGFCHLRGHSHSSAAEREQMRAEEQHLLDHFDLQSAL